MDIQDIRAEIDRVDGELTRLFLERMRLAQQVADYKRRTATPLTDSGREQAIFERVRAACGEQLAPYGEELFRTLIRLSKAYQSVLLEKE